MEIFFSLSYAFLIGIYQILRKISLKKSRASVVLAIYSSVCLLLALIWIPSGVIVDFKYVLILACKGIMITLNWYLSLSVLTNTDLSIVGATQILSSALSFIAGLVIFSETTSATQVIGTIIVVGCVCLLNLTNKKSQGGANAIQFILLLICAFISAGSSIIDKYTLNSLSASQVQFWFLLFVCITSWSIFAFDCIKSKQNLMSKTDIKNFWIYLVGLVLFCGDFCLFSAYAVPNSKLITISVLSNLKNVFAVLGGVIVFKEKNVVKKIILTLFIVFGAILISI